MAGRTETTLSRQWVDTHLRALLDQLEWEADAGWRTVTDPQPCPQTVGYEPAADSEVDRRRRAQNVRYKRRRRHLKAVA